MAGVIFSEKASQEFWKLPNNIQKRIKIKLQFFSEQKNPLLFAKPMVGGDQFGEYRFRVGDYRVIFDYTQATIMVVKVGHRRNVYD